MSAATATGWAAVLEQTRRTNREGPGRYDRRTWLRVQGWRRHAGAPEPLLRARGTAAVLARVPLHLYPGERFAGSRAGFTAAAPGPGFSDAAYEEARAEERRRGRRFFAVGFDHTVADYPTLLAAGIGGLRARVRAGRQAHRPLGEHLALAAMEVALEGLSVFVARHAASWAEAPPADTAWAASLEHLAEGPPRTFREAIQLLWLTHLAFVAEGRSHNALGRLDQTLHPFYAADRAAGRLDEAEALDLLCHLWSKIEELGEVTNICIGGLRPDGTDATNELSYLMLRATREVRSPHTNLSARLHDDSPARFHQECFRTLRTGVGFPALFNDHVTVPALERLGVPRPAALDHCMVGCIETMLAGRQPAWSDSRFNLAACLLEALAALGPQAREEELLAALEARIEAGVAAHAARVRARCAACPAARYPDPLLSALTKDCIGRGRDVNAGGAEFPRFHGIAFMGLATVLDSLSALRTHVFESGRFSLAELRAALAADFAGRPALQAWLRDRTPQYGNDCAAVDRLAPRLVRLCSEACLAHRLPAGGRFVPLFAANVQNISAGAETGATPDGRRAGEPLSDAASPFFGRDRRGPTAFLRSVARPEYERVAGGSVVNMKFDPEHFRGEAGARLFEALTRVFVAERIQELQVNFTRQADLEDALEHPERHANLVVRVSGFSAYFTRLEPAVQRDVIRRRAHGDPAAALA